ncbi:hypothetical protein OH76DRAFT_841572 [Lentinus brumalis]|uniref:C2H2-type domain-containing protein n=1 Tax=Lentinus brumalis TaxID=2498619 RepID=A0A371D1P7_9APHY|nr:hypothetical protein OH76DRAFT_841572 [Polyporus brumalis]
MSFANTNATSTWGSSALSSSASSSPSPSTSRVRHGEREQRPVHTEKEASERKEEARSAGEDFRRGPLTNPEMFAPTARTPYSDVNPSSRASSASPPLSTSASSDRLQYSTRESWSPEYVRPMISKLVQYVPLRYHYGHENATEGIDPCSPPEPDRPRYSEFLQGPSRPGFSTTRRGDTASPPPSPSPSLTSFSARSPSVGFTDTEPTDEDEHLYIKREYENLELPPLRLPDSVVPTLPSIPSLTASHHRRFIGRVQRTNATSPTSALSSGSPESPVRRSIKRDLNSFPVCESDVRTRIPFRSGELPQVPSRQPWAMQQHMVPSRGRPTVPQYARDAHEPDSEQVLLSPTPKKYRFVSSRPLLRVVPIPQEVVDGDRVHSPELVGGMKRRYPTASRESSVDEPSAGSPHDGPRKRGRQQPFSVGLFPASEAAARSVRGPRGAINPAYHHDTERSLKCAFPTCNVVLSGKKAETASHMRAHFVEVAGETLHCPWPMESEDGQHVRCGMAFKDSANFGRHVSSRHIKAEEYQCNRCGRPFARRDAALRHMKTLCRPGGSGSKKKGRKKKAGRNVEDEGEQPL